MKVSYNHSFFDFLELWSSAEKKKDKVSQFKLAFALFKINNNKARVYAFELFKKSAKQGYTDAKYMLARCYHEGVGTRKSYVRAIKWYIAADGSISQDICDNPSEADKAESEALKKYFEDEEYAKSIDEILDEKEKQMTPENIFLFACDGDADSQNLLGFYYYRGIEVEKDIEKAIYWYKKAAENRNDAAMLSLAEHYEKAKLYKESAEWYRKYIEARIKWRNERLGW